jgi:DNA uptake protein ComE-like DNA-binding protein
MSNCRSVTYGFRMVYVISRNGFRLHACAFALLLCVSFAVALPALQIPGRSHNVPAPEARVDINSATLDQLLKVPGMTRTWAERIIRFRPYRTKNDLIDRGVLTNEVYARIKDYIIAHRTKE